MYKANENRYKNMSYNKCGESGLRLPAVSLGLWHNFGDTGSFGNMKNMLFTAFDNGITHFDLANNYGPDPGSAERNFGKILNEEMSALRDEMIISTKAGYFMWDGPYGDGGSRKYILSSLDQSLKRMKLDYVDIFYHHRMDKDTPLYESMWALADTVKSGKALYVGLSNYDGKTMQEAARILNELHCPFIINQNRYSIIDRGLDKTKIFDACIKDKKGMIVFSPLAQGLLTDKYIRGIPEDSRVKTDGRFLKDDVITPELVEKITKLNTVAKARGQSLAQMALAWVYNKETVASVLIGASKPEQILDCIKMLENTEFTEEELKLIDEIAFD